MEATESVRVRRIVVAVDVGQVVNMNGVRNQIEGGAVQAVSWTLKEQVRFGRDGITSLNWDTYPILRFSETPQVNIVVINRPGLPVIRAGECARPGGRGYRERPFRGHRSEGTHPPADGRERRAGDRVRRPTAAATSPAAAPQS